MFDCGSHSNQVLATIGQAFVQAGEEAENEEYLDLDDEFGVYAQQAMTEQEYQDLYGRVVSNCKLLLIGFDTHTHTHTHTHAHAHSFTPSPLSLPLSPSLSLSLPLSPSTSLDLSL